MAEQTKPVGDGNPQEPVANADEQSVSYETHRRLLSEKKRRDEENAALKARLDEIEKRDKEKMEAELKQKEDWKKMLELREKELSDKDAKLKQYEQQRVEETKLRKFLASIDGKIDSRYWQLIPIEEIAVRDNGEIDELSVTKAVETFVKKFPETVQRRNAPSTSNTAPNGQGSISYDEWRKLPVKEMRAKLKQVIAQEGA